MLFKTKDNKDIDVSIKVKHLMIAHNDHLTTYSIYDLRIALVFLSDFATPKEIKAIEDYVVETSEFLTKGDRKKCHCFLKVDSCYCQATKEGNYEVKIVEHKGLVDDRQLDMFDL